MNHDLSKGSVVVHAYDLQELKEWTDNLIRVAFRMARHGQKDEARDILRSIENGRVCELLKAGRIDVIALREALHTLRDECHPLTAPKRADDVADLIKTVEELKKWKAEMEQHQNQCVG